MCVACCTTKDSGKDGPCRIPEGQMFLELERDTFFTSIHLEDVPFIVDNGYHFYAERLIQ
jgi:hypothetical protein